MKQTILTTALFLFAFSLAFSADKPILVSADWLHQHKNDPDLIVLHVSFLRLDYEQEHIEGARFLWPGWLAPDSPEGSMNVPDPSKAAEVLQSLGISNTSHVVLCHPRNEVSPTARMFLMLEYLGLRGNVSFLNGGIEAWKQAGYLVTQEIRTYKPGKFKPKINDLIVNKDFVIKNLESPSVTLVDARAKRFYDGDPTGYPRPGHIKGAVNIPYPELLNESNLFKSESELQGYFTPVLPDKNKDAVVYCFIGQTASVVYMAGRMLGYNMKLYDGSLQEWTRIPELPMEKTEN